MQLWILACLLAVISCSPTSRTPTVYDVLQLVYQVCSTEEDQREERLTCVSSHLGKEVVSVVGRCLSGGSEGKDSVGAFCRQMTLVPEWAAKHRAPPPHLTRVLGLVALGRMACVLEEVERPLPMWQAAFAKCFPEYQSTDSLRKDGTKNRSGNSLLPSPSSSER